MFIVKINNYLNLHVIILYYRPAGGKKIYTISKMKFLTIKNPKKRVLFFFFGKSLDVVSVYGSWTTDMVSVFGLWMYMVNE